VATLSSTVAPRDRNWLGDTLSTRAWLALPWAEYDKADKLGLGAMPTAR
jgi:hypothetical protein